MHLFYMEMMFEGGHAAAGQMSCTYRMSDKGFELLEASWLGWAGVGNRAHTGMAAHRNLTYVATDGRAHEVLLD